MTIVYRQPITIQWRKMIFPNEEAKLLGVETDRNSEVVIFLMPRLYEGFDMLSKQWFVDTLNTQGDLFDTAAPSVTQFDPDNIQLMWIVGALPASVDGIVKVRLRAISDDFVWQTETGQFKIAETFETSDPPDPPGMTYFNVVSLQVASDAERAEAAAVEAQKAVESIDGLTATATGLPAGSAPTAIVTDVGDHKQIAFGIPAGATGTPGLAATIAFRNTNGVPYGTPSSSVEAPGSTPQARVYDLNVQEGKPGEVQGTYPGTTAPISQLTAPEYFAGYPLDMVARLVAAQSGTGDPSPDNVRPISGKSTLNVTRRGKNAITKDDWANNVDTTHTLVDGLFTITPATALANRGIFLSGASVVPQRYGYLAGQNLVFSFEGYGQAARVINAKCGNASGNFALTTSWQKFSFAVPTFQATEFHFYTNDTSGVTPFYIRNIQLEFGSVATTYEPYTGNTYAVALPEALVGWDAASPATIDLRSGASIDTAKLVALTGTENWVLYAGKSHTFVVNGFYGQTITPSTAKCSTFSPVSVANFDLVAGIYTANTLNLIISYPDMADIATWKAYLAAQYAAGTPVQVLYKLTAPKTLAVTPLAIPALPGLNNIYSDGGGDTSSALNPFRYRVNNAGQVKVTYTGLSLTGFTAITARALPLASATPTVAAYPVTKWPYGSSQAYATDMFVGGKLRENNVQGQSTRWRISGTYTGKGSANNGQIQLQLRNPDSGFIVTAENTLPSGLTAGNVTFELTTIADGASLATGRGYVLEALTSFADANLVLNITSITRISEATEGTAVV